MKKLVFLYFLIVIGLIFSTSASARIDPQTAAGLWLLNEGGDEEIAEDIYGNHGTLQGEPEWVDGKFGGALSLNGQSQWVTVPDADSLDLQEAWTITAWAFVNESEDSYGHILGKRNDTLNEANYAFRVALSGVNWEGYFKKDGAWMGVWGQGVVNKDEWHYMTATYDGEGIFTMYQDAVQFGTGNIGPPPPAGQADVIIGGWQDNTSELLDGVLDEAALFSVALELEDIEALMNDGIEVTMGITAIEPSGKLASTWGKIRDRQAY